MIHRRNEESEERCGCRLSPSLSLCRYFLFLEQPDRYPPNMLGRMIGYGNLVIALVGDGPPTLLKAYVQTSAWPLSKFSRYIVVQLTTTLIVVACLGFPIYLYRTRRR